MTSVDEEIQKLQEKVEKQEMTRKEYLEYLDGRIQGVRDNLVNLFGQNVASEILCSSTLVRGMCPEYKILLDERFGGKYGEIPQLEIPKNEATNTKSVCASIMGKTGERKYACAYALGKIDEKEIPYLTKALKDED